MTDDDARTNRNDRTEQKTPERTTPEQAGQRPSQGQATTENRPSSSQRSAPGRRPLFRT